MAVPGNEEYKQKLCQRNVSHTAEPGEVKDKEDHTAQKEVLVGPDTNQQVPEESGSPNPAGGVSPTLKENKGGEIPVVTMLDFEIVNTDDKLNLLMAAINKVNTNFHMKFESLTKWIKEGMQGRIEALETKYEEVLA